MRLLSWNINGIRTLPAYHPWNTLKTCEAILKELNADIICFQEMKTSRASLERHVALPEGYDSFFSFPVIKGGYSGVAVYTNRETTVPLRAEEGLSGGLQPKPPLSADERISVAYPDADNVPLVPDEDGNIPTSLLELDKEGRALVVDFGLFVLINLYCPNEGSDARASYKLNFHYMLGERVNQLIGEGREVIVTGDINICSAPIDHCDGQLASRANEFWEHPARAWLKNWLDPEGPMVDVVRRCWPDRKGMYTCWNTKISARESNYGTRIDYFLLTRGLLPWFKHGDIQPSLKGSDHCPIYIDLHDEITTESGKTLTLCEAMQMDGPQRAAPRLAAKYWSEFSSKQKLLSTFFGQQMPTLQGTSSQSSKSSPSSTPSEPDVISVSADAPAMISTVETIEADDVVESSTAKDAEESCKNSMKPIGKLPVPPEPTSSATKRKKMQVDSNYRTQPPKKAKKQTESGQAKLSSFFAKPSHQANPSEVIIIDEQDNDDDAGEINFTQPEESSTSNAEKKSTPDRQMSEDYSLALSLAEEYSAVTPTNSSTTNSKDAWSQLFAPIEPPKCIVHGEPTKEYRVNKPGPNKGKTFFLCSRPVGPGYDSGKSTRLREEVDPKYRCNYFKWTSDVKKASLSKLQKTGSQAG